MSFTISQLNKTRWRCFSLAYETTSWCTTLHQQTMFTRLMKVCTRKFSTRLSFPCKQRVLLIVQVYLRIQSVNRYLFINVPIKSTTTLVYIEKVRLLKTYPFHLRWPSTPQLLLSVVSVPHHVHVQWILSWQVFCYVVQYFCSLA